MSDERKERMVFAVAMDADGAGCTIMIGITQACWAEMQADFCKDANFHPVGIPVKLIVYGCKDHDDAVRVLKESALAAGADFTVETQADFGIK